jgi:hypothetical protein
MEGIVPLRIFVRKQSFYSSPCRRANKMKRRRCCWIRRVAREERVFSCCHEPTSHSQHLAAQKRAMLLVVELSTDKYTKTRMDKRGYHDRFHRDSGMGNDRLYHFKPRLHFRCKSINMMKKQLRHRSKRFSKEKLIAKLIQFDGERIKTGIEV